MKQTLHVLDSLRLVKYTRRLKDHQEVFPGYSKSQRVLFGTIVLGRKGEMEGSTLGQHEKGQVISSDEHKAKTKSKGRQSEGFIYGTMNEVASLILDFIPCTKPR